MMNKYTQNLIRMGAILLVALGVVGPAGFAAAVPVQAATFFPGAVCESGSCDLYAKPGTLTMPDGAVVPIWGFAPDAGSPAVLPGPTLVGTAGGTIDITLHNGLDQALSLDFPGFPMVPDLTGAAPGGTEIYSLTLAEPGTYIYQAGLTANGPRQVAMGLYGAIVVRPAGQPLQAYDDATTAFDDEALLIFSEIDPAFNASPGTFMMEDFNPRYWLINGKSYPQTDAYTTDAGRRILFRYVNAGFDHHPIGLLGVRETLVAKDAVPLAFPYMVNTEIMGAGQTMDVLVDVPATAITGTKYLLYETSLIQHNANQRLATGGPVAVGGMMTSITVGLGAPSPLVGPLVSGAGVTPSPTTGSEGVTLTATMAPGGVAIEYFIDVLGDPGTGVGLLSYPIFLPAMIKDGAGGAPPALEPVPGPVVSGTTYSFVIPASVLNSLSGGYHTFYIRGRDASGVWGPVTSVVLNLDKIGPATTGLTLLSSPTNGQVDVQVRATADDLHFGNAVVTGATYAIDDGTPQPMLLAKHDDPIVAITATIPADAILPLSEGIHTVTVRATDSMGNLGDPATIPLVVDKTGPTTGEIILDPPDFLVTNPPPVNTLQIRAQINDTGVVSSNVTKAEGFLNGAGPEGTGFTLFITDGILDEPSEEVWFDVAAVNYSEWGVYWLAIRAQDAAGNWGPISVHRIVPPGDITDLKLPLILR